MVVTTLRIVRRLGAELKVRKVQAVAIIRKLQSQRLILLPELGSVVIIILSGLLVTTAVFFKFYEDYHLYRLPFAFMTASWLISSKAMLLVMFFFAAERKTGLFHAVVDVFEATWYVPCLLLMLAYFWLSKDLGGGDQEIFIQVLLALGYYPAMVAIIALSAWLRMKGKNGILLKANYIMLLLYFLPVSMMICFGLVSLVYVLHLIGSSYLIRGLIIIYLSRVRRNVNHRLLK